jgi:hypothetical protein
MTSEVVEWMGTATTLHNRQDDEDVMEVAEVNHPSN